MTVAPTTLANNAQIRRWSLARSFSIRSLTLGLTIAVVSYLVLVPLLMLLYASVKSTEDKLPFESTVTTLDNYVAIFTSPSTLPIFLNTFLFTAGSLAVGLPMAVLMAWLLERTAIPARRWIATLILVPMTIPSLLSAIAWIQLLDPRIGLINVVLRGVLGLSGDTGPFDIYTLTGMCFVQGLRLVPSAFLMIAASFRAMDPSLEEQSAMAGRGAAQTTLRITLPIMRPALLAMLIYYIIVVIESFDIPGLLGFTARIRVLSTAIYWATHSEVGLPDYGLASALGATVLAVALLLMWLYQRLTAHQERFATITGKGYRPRQVRLGAWTAPATALCVFYVALAVVLPFLMLLWTSVQPFYAIPSADSFARVSLEGYANIWRDGSIVRALWNTTVLALVTPVATILLAVLVSWFVVRRRKAADGLSHYLATVSFLPQCVPSIVIGLAFIFVYVRFPIPIYGTLWIIALAMTTRYLAYSSRTMTSALMQVHGELEEASQMARAPWARTLRRITIPLLAPAMINVFLWVAVHAMQELSMALMLYNPDTVVVSTMIWSMWQNGKTADAAVLGVILILLSALLLLGGQAVSYLRRGSNS
ncbi:MAG: iron ABC transporter permease [Deltaproteobacteria bacterium]|nr:iron ABC transporter permease [Deltaproteobacteria bacterium]MDZ4342958.1 iron ABC transporter permease [Candidatus Binatia bacterium]